MMMAMYYLIMLVSLCMVSYNHSLVAIKILQFKFGIEHFDCITMNVDLIRQYYTVNYMNVHL